ncbi:hypothetical protein A2V61_01545 [Candidatus Woesebacteria bacterium RBG_19FT_COMBO_47_8]|uniref:Mannosyl-glycoprotein endo-beta-N-acetylglucosamidase-like domain-containing protein n=1 Tax=Candidatus Woesebacteria bacterium RBG_13_46_13 TaxID=1802479 RepID=A0A1F7X3R5_9BACT|nr:MAG: hypothetical protein A2Y68_03365 [Candidatus Woesebacteria bacterium RBG_13_46_13]OGM17409.1 MAG: hypothetical protein A2V61_01545 [Candidatus Woesebacteria bacterium RBG_19FT_COMBO_47_8]HJX59596.1 hypothetical protein [Patescibacteria group bacterium]
MHQENFTFKEDFSFWKNLFLIAIFFTVAPLTLATSLFSLLSLSKNGKAENPNLMESNYILYPQSGVKVFASLPTTLPEISGDPNTADARSEIVRQYLASYASPLVPYSDFIVATADRYQLDYRLITAIAQQESNLCKIIPPGSYNCWGWGIHSRGTLGFTSFEEGIDTVSQGIRNEYLNKGYETIEDIMSKYTPLSNGSWAAGVNKFMSEME